MGIQINPIPALALAIGLLLLAFYVFSRVRSDYLELGALSRPVAVLQTGYFFVYALSSYLFLDSILTAIVARGPLLALAAILMGVGLAVVLLSMPFLGRKSFGREVGRLHVSGLYLYSRNPQLVGSFIFIIGYVLLWPSWTGLLWACVWLPIAYLMVRGEEEHLAMVFGEEYEAYRRRTPRYVGIPKRG